MSEEMFKKCQKDISKLLQNEIISHFEIMFSKTA